MKEKETARDSDSDSDGDNIPFSEIKENIIMHVGTGNPELTFDR